MNRTVYFNYIEDKMGTLAYRVNKKGRINILDLHNHSENFYVYLLNKVYGLDLRNANAVMKQNVEAIDLIDHSNKLICQVSATNTKQKVDSSLAKTLISKYPTYTFKFIAISKDSKDLKKQTFTNPHGILFNPANDIIDDASLLEAIGGMDVTHQKGVYELIKAELGGEVDMVKLDSNLAIIINILAKENHTESPEISLNTFEIERKIDHNNITVTKTIIEQYRIYYGRVDKKYNEFDVQGSNKSLSVLQSMNKSYIQEKIKFPSETSDEIFFRVLNNVTSKVLDSANYIQIPIDELEICINILVVDAFIRCKIFENPLNYTYAIA